jgi:hypothetical protein
MKRLTKFTGCLRQLVGEVDVDFDSDGDFD